MSSKAAATMRRSGMSSAGLAFSCAISEPCARVGALDLRDAFVDRRQIRRGDDVARRRFDVVDERRPASPTARARRRVRRAARRTISPAPRCARPPPDRGRPAAAHWFWTRRWRYARRDRRSRPCRPGEQARRRRRRSIPGTRPTPITSAAAPAPDTAAVIDREDIADADGPPGLLGRGLSAGGGIPGFAGYFRGFQIDGRRPGAWAGPILPTVSVSSGLSSTITAVPCWQWCRNAEPDSADPLGETPLKSLTRSGPQRTVQRLEQGIFVRRAAPP